MEQRETGTVRWFNSSKGYGFIHRESGEDIFAHYSSITGAGFRSLEEGQKVSFEVFKSDRGLQAKNIKVID